MRKKIPLFTAGGACLFVFLVLLVLLLTVDVAPTGAYAVRVGLSTSNAFFFAHCRVGSQDVWDTLSDVLMFLSIAVAVGFAVFGLAQAIRRRSLLKMDIDLWALAALYVVLTLIYVLFELVVVNCRPVLADGVAESSFPSSHTLFVGTILGTAAVQCRHRVKNKPFCIVTEVLAQVLTLLTAAARILAGMHWFTDVLGALLLCAALVCFYCIFLQQKIEQ